MNQKAINSHNSFISFALIKLSVTGRNKRRWSRRVEYRRNVFSKSLYLAAPMIALLMSLMSNNLYAANDDLVRRGEQVYQKWCTMCHNPQTGGAMVLLNLLGNIPGVLEERTGLSAGYIKIVVRYGRPPRMSGLRPTEVSDVDLEAIVAYLTRNNKK